MVRVHGKSAKSGGGSHSFDLFFARIIKAEKPPLPPNRGSLVAVTDTADFKSEAVRRA